MSESLADLLKNSSGDQVKMVTASHLATEFETLNKLYDSENTRDASFLLALNWLESGSPLRKAAVKAWAKEKHIDMGDRPDPDATPPKPNDLSDGIDAPDSGNKAAGAGAASNEDQKNPTDGDGKNHHKPGRQDPKAAKGNLIAMLRSMRGKPGDKGHGGSATSAAYEAGVRDATAKHAATAHRIGATAARHAFKLGTEAGHRVGHMQAKMEHDQHGIGLPIPAQAGITAPVMKGTRAQELAKAFDGSSHPRNRTGTFAAKRTSPSYLRAFGRGVAEGLPGAAVVGLGAYRGSRAMRAIGAFGAVAGHLHGRYASFKNQAKQAGVKNPGKSAARLTAASNVGDLGGPVLGAITTHLVGFGKRAPASERVSALSKLGDK